MIKIGTFLAAIVCAASLLALNKTAASASAYTIAHTETGTPGSLTVTGSTFAFTDPADVITGLGAGDLTITGDYSGTNATHITAILSESPTTSVDLITNGSGSFLYLPTYDFTAAYSLTGSNGADLSYSTTSLVSGSFTSGGGSYTSPAPEASSLIALAAMLAAGGILMATLKSKTKANIS